ncbi:MAG: VCBS repeat-containing protein [Myxococcota bacterium]
MTYIQHQTMTTTRTFVGGPQNDPLRMMRQLFNQGVGRPYGMPMGGFGPMQRMQMAMALMQMQQQIQGMMSQLLFGGFNPMPVPGPGGVPGGMPWLKPELPELSKGKWIAPHGGYKALGNGRYEITKGQYAKHTLVHQGKGMFHVFDPCGCLKGQWQSPAKKDKIASPLTFDLNGDGKVSTTQGGKAFDIDGDGKIDNTAWAGAGDGVLAFDADGDGKVGENGRELFGNNTDIDGDGKADGHANGFDALRALAQKEFGAVGDKLDAGQLAHLSQKYNLKMIVDGQQKSLADLGITEINLGYEEAGANADANGNEHRQVGTGFTMNGENRAVNDVWFRYS